MPQADFYVLPVADPAARQRFLCRLAEKIVLEGHQVFVLCEGEPEARELNSLLWSFKPESFIPHRLADSEQSAPMTLGWKASQGDTDAVFVNLTLSLPEQAISTERVVEIVVQDPSVLTATRQHFKQYKDAGYHINMNDMRPKRQGTR